MLSRQIIYAFFVTLISQTLSVPSNYKLQLVQMIYRHGDRAPKSLYPTDPNPESAWPLGLGQLTNLGKQQHYQLGKLFRDMYKDFFTTKPTEVDAVSTDVDRCLASAEANFAAFYAPTKPWKFNPDLNWQPIPITSIPVVLDKFLGNAGSCPKFDAEVNDVLHSPVSQAFINDHKKMFKYLTANSGMPIHDYLDAHEIYDILFIEKKYNLTIPKWVDPIWKELQEVDNYQYNYIYNSTTIQQFRAGPFFKILNQIFDKKLQGNAPELKFRTYSSHDANIAVILEALNNLNPKPIPYCATLIFELYSAPNNRNFVRMLYLNTTNDDKYDQIPNVLTLDGCQEFCPYRKFLEYTKRFVTDEYKEQCTELTNSLSSTLVD